MRLSLMIAWRYLRSRNTHNAVNIISLIALLAVVVTTAAIVCVLSVFNGFRGLIMDRLACLDAPIAITAAEGKTISDADSLIQVLTAIEGVTRATPVVEDQALAIYADYQMPVTLRGVPDDYNATCSIDSLIVYGSWIMRQAGQAHAVAGVGPALAMHINPDYPL